MRLTAITIAGLCAVTLAACADTVQQKPIPHDILEALIAAAHPVYWLGERFHGMQIIEAAHDPGGAYSVQYGNCLEGGQGTCVPPLRVISSPDNSFLPGGSTPSRSVSIRGARAVLVQSGRAIVIATGAVIVDIYAANSALARAAAEEMVPINAAGAPREALPARLPDSGFGASPLPSQVASPLHPLSP